jgi:citrate synthase
MSTSKATLSIDTGLETIIAAQTRLSDVDGQGGRLTICGYDVGVLAQGFAFEEALALVWEDCFGPNLRVEALKIELARLRKVAFENLPSFGQNLQSTELLRQALARCEDKSDLNSALYLVAMCGVATAALGRHARGLPPLAPNPHLAHCDDILAMMTGRRASQEEVKALNAYLVTVCDHGLNASTFTTRVVASTQAGLASAVIAGLSALKGPLHGGAPGPVLDMLDAIGEADQAEAWIEAAFERGDRLMGFGHRIYKVRDPRADALKQALARLPKNAGRLAFAEAIETTALKRLAARYPKRALETNVEYYTALLMEALDIPREIFTCMFACGRVIGWVAHAQEQVATGRIVRPQSLYVGPLSKDAA